MFVFFLYYMILSNTFLNYIVDTHGNVKVMLTQKIILFASKILVRNRRMGSCSGVFLATTTPFDSKKLNSNLKHKLDHLMT
jgi:hypothetical protein